LVLHFYSDQGKYDYLSDKLILMENKLGISSGCVTEIHKSNRDLMKKFRKLYNHDDPKETLISAYKKEPKSIIFLFSNSVEKELTEDEFAQFIVASRNVLLINGENSTYQNIRRDILDLKRLFIDPSNND
jgi:hypothetical protein